MDKIVTSIQEINLEDIRFPIIAVFEHPEDYPTKSIGRIFELTKPTDTVIVKDTLEEFVKLFGKNYLEDENEHKSRNM